MTFETIMDSQNQFYVKREERIKEGSFKLKVITQPADVQVKRVGRASCLEPEIKLSLESESTAPTTITINAYLKVLGSDNKHKHILLKKADPIMFNKAHRKEILGMKLRFLKTIKVQVLKRNLGVSRPEASVVFEAVNEQNQVVSAAQTTHFAIISDPRYLDEVKKRRATDRSEEGYQSPDSDDGQYNPTNKRGPKRRKLMTREQVSHPYIKQESESTYPSVYGSRPMMPPALSVSHPVVPTYSAPTYSAPTYSAPTYSASTYSYIPTSIPLPQCTSINSLINPVLSDTAASLSALKACADYELSFANSQEEEDTLALLVDSLKYKRLHFPTYQTPEQAH